MKSVDYRIGEANHPIAVDGSAVRRPDDISLGMPGLLRRLLETLLLALLFPGLGLLLSPEDPLFMEQGIPWLLMVAPLLIGVRYGTSLALLAVAIEALLLGASTYDVETARWDADILLAGHVIALCVVAVLCGELSAQQRRKLRQMHVLNKAMAHRQESFLRHYHVLRVSHDQLVEHLAAAPFALRDTLTHLERQFCERLGARRGSLADVGNEVLLFIAQHSRIQRAALIMVDDQMRPQPPVAWLGAQCELSLQDAMLLESISSKKLISLRDMLSADANSPVAVIPLVDVDSRLHGVIVVIDMPFIDFSDSQMHMLTVIGARLGDLTGMAHQNRPDLKTSVRQWVKHAQHERLSSLLASVTFQPELNDKIPEVFWLIDSHRRGLDQAWCLTASDGTTTIVLLMPLSPAKDIQAYKERMAPLIEQTLESHAEATSIDWLYRAVDGTATADELLRALVDGEEMHASL
ncbi:PelD GGDEF domain-containing protein [Vreelandella subglaciescola]|jgi:hypothetical protein|uniref:PelD GGDEF domain-containing protein n=1 Tax=Vreelandella subglaciescola TaxID=29571 RepID=A0A1M7IGP0_9GAMM|nr:PelD GGDEF domain-containing protein [Halomonas subglaciescola]SHM39954.1 PelD GGDEF domain-containing protein [Halomonas subglaciescola]